MPATLEAILDGPLGRPVQPGLQLHRMLILALIGCPGDNDLGIEASVARVWHGAHMELAALVGDRPRDRCVHGLSFGAATAKDLPGDRQPAWQCCILDRAHDSQVKGRLHVEDFAETDRKRDLLCLWSARRSFWSWAGATRRTPALEARPGAFARGIEDDGLFREWLRLVPTRVSASGAP